MSHDIARGMRSGQLDQGTSAECVKRRRARRMDKIAARPGRSFLARCSSPVSTVSRHPIGDYDPEFWRESVDCIRDTDVTEATGR